MRVTSGPIPTLPAADLGRATKFFEDILHFTPSDRTQLPGSVLYAVGSGELLVYETQHAGTAQNTAAAWFVADIDEEVARLQSRGITFDTFELPDGEWDGVTASLGNVRCAWFHDTEGNILCLNEET